MAPTSSADLARENALVKGIAKLYPALELECEGKRAVCVGGHEDDIDSINVVADGGKVVLISEWVLEHCLQLPGGTTGNQVDDRKLTLTKPCVLAYGNKHVHKTPLLQWCREMCKAHDVQDLNPGRRVLVFWWDTEHSSQDKQHMLGKTWWPAVYVPKYNTYGVWYSARVVRFDPKRVTLHIVYDYNEPDELELSQLILPLNYVHFGDSPPPPGGQAQVFPPPCKPPLLVYSQPTASQQSPSVQQQQRGVASNSLPFNRQHLQQHEQPSGDGPAGLLLQPSKQQHVELFVDGRCGGLPALKLGEQQQLKPSSVPATGLAGPSRQLKPAAPSMGTGAGSLSAPDTERADVAGTTCRAATCKGRSATGKRQGTQAPVDEEKGGKWIKTSADDGQQSGGLAGTPAVELGPRGQHLCPPHKELHHQSRPRNSVKGTQQQGLPLRPSAGSTAAVVGTSQAAAYGNKQLLQPSLPHPLHPQRSAADPAAGGSSLECSVCEASPAGLATAGPSSKAVGSRKAGNANISTGAASDRHPKPSGSTQSGRAEGSQQQKAVARSNQRLLFASASGGLSITAQQPQDPRQQEMWRTIKQKGQERSSTQQHPHDDDDAGRPATAEPSSLQQKAAGCEQVHIMAAGGAAGRSNGCRDIGTQQRPASPSTGAHLGAMLHEVDLSMGPTSRVLWPVGNRQRAADSFHSRAADLVSRPAAVPAASDAHVLDMWRGMVGGNTAVAETQLPLTAAGNLKHSIKKGVRHNNATATAAAASADPGGSGDVFMTTAEKQPPPPSIADDVNPEGAAAPMAAAAQANAAAATFAGCFATLRDTLTHLSSAVSGPFSLPQQHLQLTRSAMEVDGHAGAIGEAAAAAMVAATAAVAVVATGTAVPVASSHHHNQQQKQVPMSPRSMDARGGAGDDDMDDDSECALQFMGNSILLPTQERLAAYEALVPET